MITFQRQKPFSHLLMVILYRIFYGIHCANHFECCSPMFICHLMAIPKIDIVSQRRMRYLFIWTKRRYKSTSQGSRVCVYLCLSIAGERKKNEIEKKSHRQLVHSHTIMNSPYRSTSQLYFDNGTTYKKKCISSRTRLIYCENHSRSLQTQSVIVHTFHGVSLLFFFLLSRLRKDETQYHQC